MRIIDSNLLSKLKSNNYTNLKQKILLYRRKWNNGAFEIESSPIDITSLILCDKYETGKVFLDCKILLIISLKIALFTEFVA